MTRTRTRGSSWHTLRTWTDGAFVNERVCFNVDSKADGVFGYSGSPDAHAVDRWRGGSAEGQERRVPVTDVNGNAAVEVLNSDPEVINVIADFDPEGLLRSIDVDFRGPATPPADPFKPGTAGHDGGHAVADR